MSKKKEDEQKPPRWARNAALARYLNISPMSVWRWARDPELKFPQPSVINNISYTNLDEVDAWLRARVVDHTLKSEKAA
jgi:hypothetical protein